MGKEPHRMGLRVSGGGLMDKTRAIANLNNLRKQVFILQYLKRHRKASYLTLQNAYVKQAQVKGWIVNRHLRRIVSGLYSGFVISIDKQPVQLSSGKKLKLNRLFYIMNPSLADEKIESAQKKIKEIEDKLGVHAHE